MERDSSYQMAASNIRFGVGCTREVGMDLADMGARRTLLVIDPALVDLPVGQTVLESLRAAKIEYDLFDGVTVEPTDDSFRAAAEVARAGQYDAFLGVGGGSALDTAKAANLYSTWPADFFDYVNAPIGKGLPVPGPVKPMIAIPTTAGTGSETTGTAIFDWHSKKVKTGISHRFLKPVLGLLDPENTRTQPAAVAASCGLDVLSHALESFTALPFDQRPRPERPSQRPAYQGANPLSDGWALRALEMTADYLERAVADPSDDEARGQMLLASAIAGIGFGNAGVHLPHAMAYPVAGKVRDFRPDGYRVDHPLIPHGMSVILHTPAVVRFTASADPEKHLEAAAALGADISHAMPEEAGEILADRIIDVMRALKMPNGLQAVGYSEADLPELVEGTLAQQRLTRLSPRTANPDELTALFVDSMRIW